MSEWRVTDKAGWDERTGKAVYTVTKDSPSLNAGDQDELKELLAQVWQPIETAPKDVLVFLYSPPQSGDYPDDIRITADFYDTESECWYNHNEDREHFECVAPMGSVGPSVEAPYTHWRPYFTAPTN